MVAAVDNAIIPSERDVKIAQESGRRLSRFAKRGRVTLQAAGEGGSSGAIELPRSVVGLLVRILSEMGQSNAVTVTPVHTELTTQQAASMLGVSRPFLIKQMKAKKIPHRMIGTHRRVRLADLMQYKARLDTDRAEVLKELAAQAQELDMGY